MSRKKAREESMKLLFQMDAQNDFSDKIKDGYLDTLSLNESDRGYINIVLASVKDNLSMIDERINKYSSWKVNHMAKADLAILRLAVAEMSFVDDVPASVAINEAVELAKLYGDEHSPAFINGILAQINRETDKQ